MVFGYRTCDSRTGDDYKDTACFNRVAVSGRVVRSLADPTRAPLPIIIPEARFGRPSSLAHIPQGRAIPERLLRCWPTETSRVTCVSREAIFEWSIDIPRELFRSLH